MPPKAVFRGKSLRKYKPVNRASARGSSRRSRSQSSERSKSASGRKPLTGASRRQSRSRSQSHGRSASAGNQLAVVRRGKPNRQAMTQEQITKAIESEAEIIKTKSLKLYLKNDCVKRLFTVKRATYSEQEKNKARNDFRDHLMQAQQSLPMISDLFLKVGTTMTTVQRTYEGPKSKGVYTEVESLNTHLISAQITALSELISAYKVATDKYALETQIVKKIKHITGQIATNSEIFTMHRLKLGQEDFDRFAKSCGVHGNEVPNFVGVKGELQTDHDNYEQASKEFSVIRKSETFDKILKIHRDDAFTLRQNMATREDFAASVTLTRAGNKNRPRTNTNDPSTDRSRILSPQDANDPLLLTDGTESQLSTQDLLTQMKAMQLAM
jgi:hypothetical protein